MSTCLRYATLLFVITICAAGIPAYAQPRQGSESRQLFFPLVSQAASQNPFGFDLRYYVGDSVMPYVSESRPKWTRAGDVFWSDIEPVRGVYRWEALVALEANILRLRQAGIEPTLIIQRTPEWAQKLPGRLCGPMKRENIDDFTRFVKALVERYSSGPLQVNYWEIGNETDVAPDQVRDEDGFGCWADRGVPDKGGKYYAEVLKRVYPVIKAANPEAQVIGGALLYFWPDDSVSRAFLTGILDAGGASAFDILSFHAYGEWGAGDLLLSKTLRIREILGRYGLSRKPLFATEIAATCYEKSCPPNFIARQANYAARIYAQASALQLKGAFWFTLAINEPLSFRSSQLIDAADGQLMPRPSYYAFRNSAQLLSGARYVGPPLREPPADQMQEVQSLKFSKPGAALYVLWVPQIDFPRKAYGLAVTPGSKAICTQLLDMPTPYRFYCNDTNNDGVIWLAVNSFPQYVEVLGPGSSAVTMEQLPSAPPLDQTLELPLEQP